VAAGRPLVNIPANRHRLARPFLGRLAVHPRLGRHRGRPFGRAVFGRHAQRIPNRLGPPPLALGRRSAPITPPGWSPPRGWQGASARHGSQGRAGLQLGVAGHRLRPPPRAHPPPPHQPRRPGLLLLPRAFRPGLFVYHVGARGGAPLTGRGRFPSWENRLRPGRQPGPPPHCPHPAPGASHGRARRLRHHRRVSTLPHRHPGPPASPGELPPEDPGLILLTVAEIKRVVNLVTRAWQSIRHYLHWSWWRRRHQARAWWFHQRARLRKRAANP